MVVSGFIYILHVDFWGTKATFSRRPPLQRERLQDKFEFSCQEIEEPGTSTQGTFPIKPNLQRILRDKFLSFPSHRDTKQCAQAPCSLQY